MKNEKKESISNSYNYVHRFLPIISRETIISKLLFNYIRINTGRVDDEK